MASTSLPRSWGAGHPPPTSSRPPASGHGQPPDLYLSRLSDASFGLRPRPSPPLGRGRRDQKGEPGTALSSRSPASAPHRMEISTPSRRRLLVAEPFRPQLHHQRVFALRGDGGGGRLAFACSRLLGGGRFVLFVEGIRVAGQHDGEHDHDHDPDSPQGQEELAAGDSHPRA